MLLVLKLISTKNQLKWQASVLIGIYLIGTFQILVVLVFKKQLVITIWEINNEETGIFCKNIMAKYSNLLLI